MHGRPKAPSPKGTPGRPGRPSRVATSQPGTTQSTSDMTNNSAPTFYSCLSIPVQGVKPIVSDNSAEQSGSSQQATTSAGANDKRTPRKSKTEALAALNGQQENQSRATSVSFDEEEPPDLLAEMYHNTAPIPVSPALDLSSVRTARLRDYKQPSNTPRPFGLENCPEYRPTMEEFKDPMAYVRSISEEAKRYGICKIIPPEEWSMPFLTDTEVGLVHLLRY